MLRYNPCRFNGNEAEDTSKCDARDIFLILGLEEERSAH